jgi:hypothetical protein
LSVAWTTLAKIGKHQLGRELEEKYQRFPLADTEAIGFDGWSGVSAALRRRHDGRQALESR